MSEPEGTIVDVPIEDVLTSLLGLSLPGLESLRGFVQALQNRRDHDDEEKITGNLGIFANADRWFTLEFFHEMNGPHVAEDAKILAMTFVEICVNEINRRYREERRR